MGVYLNGQNVGITKELKSQDRLQWVCDNMKSLASIFKDYKGTDLNILQGLDTAKVESFEETFYGCSEYQNFPHINTQNVKNFYFAFRGNTKLLNFPVSDFSSAENMLGIFMDCSSLSGDITVDAPNCTNLQSAFQNTKIENIVLLHTNQIKIINAICSNTATLKTISPIDLSSSSNAGAMFSGCTSLKEINISNSQNVTNFSSFANRCSSCKTIKTVDLLKNTQTGIFTSCTALENLTVKNVKCNLQIGSGTTWGQLLTNESLLNTAKELWDNTDNALGATRTLTLSTASKNAIQNIFVKLVDVTDEMIGEDEYVINKKPCVVCESTVEGAMTLQEYILSKNWIIA